MRFWQVAPVHEAEAALLRGIGNFHTDADWLAFLGMNDDLRNGRGSASTEEPRGKKKESGNRGIGEPATLWKSISPFLRFSVSPFLRTLLLPLKGYVVSSDSEMISTRSLTLL